LGHNAIEMMMDLLGALKGLDIPFTPHPVLGGFTMNIGTIHGGVKVNVVPDRCTATVDMRTVPGQNHADLLARLETLLAELGHRIPAFRATVRHAYDLPPVETAPDAPAVLSFSDAVQEATGRTVQPHRVRFATEGAIFIPALGTPTLIFGPGDPALAHQPNEYVEIERMVEAARIYALAAVKLLS
jgi:succinyl-diaminopimelate desuccinylase